MTNLKIKKYFSYIYFFLESFSIFKDQRKDNFLKDFYISLIIIMKGAEVCVLLLMPHTVCAVIKTGVLTFN